MTTTLTPTQQDAVAKILALRKLSKANGMQTTRAQNQVLQSLSEQDLAAVAVALEGEPK